ncbi:MAG: response regulator [Rubrivivax sp.]
MKQVLIVDDNEVSRIALADLLEYLGYSVASAVDGFEGIEVFRRIPSIAVLITDVEMPGMNGVEMLQELCQEIRERSVRVFVLSGSELDDWWLHARAHGAIGWLHKPVDPVSLEAALRILGER